MGRFAILCYLWLGTIGFCPFVVHGLVWPTPNPAFQQGRGVEEFIQPTASGTLESGLFGCVRNGGSRFHEGIDLFPLRRDRSGEAADVIYSVLPGRVVHVNSVSGHSSYGRYIVVEHDRAIPAFVSLYSHLSTIAEGVKPGVRVDSGSVLGVMGRSAGGYSIPKSRAHLHFEIGFQLTNGFQEWYEQQGYEEPNRHGIWNGMNLVGIDPLAFYQAVLSGRVDTMKEHLFTLPIAARIRVFSRTTPDFINRYPSLLTRSTESGEVIAWDIAFTPFGLPLQWTPRFATEGLSGRPGDVQILAYQSRLLKAQPCQRVLNLSASGPRMTTLTQSNLKKLFGFR
ncbi:MAG: M23 family metallopeptidase [Coraliomargaritaceae bacterium]